MLGPHDRIEPRPRLLLVDDADFVRDSLYTVLEDGGYEVLAANGGPAALTMFRQFIYPVELLVTDYVLCTAGGIIWPALQRRGKAGGR